MERILHRNRRTVRFHLLDLLSRMLETRRQRLHLRDLSEHRLKDIGITKEEARAEANRPVWDVPLTWLR